MGDRVGTPGVVSFFSRLLMDGYSFLGLEYELWVYFQPAGDSVWPKKCIQSGHNTGLPHKGVHVL